MEIIKLDLPIQGMTCANCAARIDKSLKNLPGIITSNVNIATDSAYVEFEKDNLSFDAIKNLIEKLGYKVFSNISDEVKDDFELEEEREIQKQKRKFIISLLLSILIMLLSMDIIPLPDSPVYNFIKSLFLFITASIVIFYSGFNFFIGFYHSLKNKYADMNTLIALGTGVAYIYSTYLIISNFIFNGNMHFPHVFYDTSSTIITFILLGKLLEKRTRKKSSSAIRNLMNLRPKEVTIKRNNFEMIIPVEFVKKDDIILIKPGDKIPVDGKIIKGNSTIDESLITGEGLPVEKQPGDSVIGGTINKFGSFEFIAEKIGKETYLANIIEMVKNSQNAKIKIQKYADKIASIFVPAVISISILTFIIWFWIIPNGNLSFALLNAVSVLIISCPCALGLATPTAIITGIGKAAETGIFFRNSDTLETVKELTTIVFDKTGTITTGELNISKIITSNDTKEEELLRIVGSLEKLSEHPIAYAIQNRVNELKLNLYDVDNFEALSGFGVKGKIKNDEYFIGNHDLVKNMNISPENEFKKFYDESLIEGSIIIFIIKNSSIIGIILMEDSIKPGAVELVKKLHDKKFEVILLTGDNKTSAHKIGQHIKFDDIISNVKPEGKLEVIKDLQSKNKFVAMVGDGINDAPALSQSNIGIALGSGTDIAINSSDITISRNEMNLVFSAIQISQQTMRIIKQNLFWAFFYNIICIPIAAGALFPMFGFLLNPAIASLAMAFSSVTVVSNSLRLKTIKTG
jgi:heavy metal translocating P-type ATPase